MKKYEYETKLVYEDDDESEILNKMGAKGWELIFRKDGHHLYREELCFKREL